MARAAHAEDTLRESRRERVRRRTHLGQGTVHEVDDASSHGNKHKARATPCPRCSVRWVAIALATRQGRFGVRAWPINERVGHVQGANGWKAGARRAGRKDGARGRGVQRARGQGATRARAFLASGYYAQT